MMPVKNVELTKVHYFETAKHHRNVEIPTVSQEVFQNTYNRNVIIKKNIFGHKWVLKINELEDGGVKKGRSVRCLIYCVVFSCISIAILSGIFFTFNLEKKLFKSPCVPNIQNISKITRSTEKILKNQMQQDEKRAESFMSVEQKKQRGNETKIHQDMFNVMDFPNSQNSTNRLYCTNCTEDHICLKADETEIPNCVEIVDRHDPTGCGGHCLWNVEFCAILDKQHKIYQCSPLNNLLKCPRDTFNCGEQCISRKKVCDGIVHCKDMQDERFCDCNPEDNFQCTNSSKCLPKSKKCDGTVDCWDRSDEIHCYKGCPPDQYSCLNGQCIAKDNFCDGIAHCSDFSDEPQGCLIQN